jgi:hypothetical protein
MFSIERNFLTVLPLSFLDIKLMRTRIRAQKKRNRPNNKITKLRGLRAPGSEMLMATTC